MKTKTFLLLFAIGLFTACDLDNDRIRGHAVIVDNFKDKNPLEGVSIELKYTTDEGYNYNFLQSVTTDKNGYFKIDAEYKTDFMCIDCWTVAEVYSDLDHTDTLGNFGFQFANNTYSYKTIHLDTFSLSHKIWIIPRIINLGGFQPDQISIDFYNCDLVDNSKKEITYSGAVKVNQTFTPVELEMSMNTQHWLSYGTGDLARGSLKKDTKEIAFGYFKLEKFKRTIEGDTLYLDFNVEKTK
jgi:hypothetical protein